MRGKIIAFVVGTAFILCGGLVDASTPDGETPAEESVCDGNVGAAMGLCNAYCEAMDCHLENPSASQNACDNVRNKYINKTGHDLPCEEPPPAPETQGPGCPCASASATWVGDAGFCSDTDFGMMVGWNDGTLSQVVDSIEGAPATCWTMGLVETVPLNDAEYVACRDQLIDASLTLECSVG